MTVRALALGAALLSACAEPITIAARDGTSHEDMRELPEVVVEACEILGVACEAGPSRWGTIDLDLVTTTDLVHGRTRADTRCRPWVWVHPRPVLIAHELGHALGLEHRGDDPGALMAPARPGDRLDADELDEIERGGNRLVGCR